MTKRWAGLLLVLLTGVVLSSAGAQTRPVQNSVKLYRYSVLTDTYDHGYRSEIAGGATPKGTYYRVERDAQGRMVRVTMMRDGKEQKLTTFHYTGASRFYDSSEAFVNGEKTQISLYQRDPQGRLVREDDETADGKLTKYYVVTWSPQHAEVMGYDPGNKRTYRAIEHFSIGGVEVNKTSYLSPTSDASYVELEIDEHTGLSQSARQLTDGKLDNTRRFTYDANGGETRMDAYGPDGVWFAAHVYSDGLLSQTLYKFSDGSNQEFNYSYDGKKFLKQTDVVVAGKPLCKLTYDMESDGTVKRTLAIGNDGTLWAEYPAPIVRDIQQNGQPVGRTDGILHKTGNWW